MNLELFMKMLQEADYSLLGQPEVALFILMVFAAILRKRGPVQAFIFVAPLTLALTALWGQMEHHSGLDLHKFYFTAFVGLGSLIVLYLVYLYTLQQTVE